MMKQGATTLWESWDGISSHDHPMFGASSAHIFRHLIGFNYKDENTVVINPCRTDLLHHINAKVKTKTGVISFEYNKKDGISFEISKECAEKVIFEFDGKTFEVTDKISLNF